ncbi:MAG TPA: FAD-dependent oxidoreductase, partial [Kineosporiaceae bacterium]
MRPYDVAVVGAGVIGQSIAWQCARRGLRVLVLDPAPGQGASRVAAGMLAPVAEASFGEQELTTLQVASLHRWPSFAAELTAASRLDIGYRTDGTLLIGLTHDDLQAVQRLQTYRQDLGLITQPVTGQAAREQEPLLNPRVCGGTRAPGDHQVDPRRLLRALTTALNDLDVEIV